jgi:T-complex protein 1 subunit eta
MLPSLPPGGGATELNVSRHLKEQSLAVEGKLQLVIAAFSRALELIPRQLADNAGFDSTDILNRLRQKHAGGGGSGGGNGCCWWGVDIDKEGICDTFERGIWEPAASKVNSFASATEAACLILSVDETVRNPASQQPEGGPAGRGGGMGGQGMGRGAPMSAALGGGGMRSMIGRGRGVRVMQGKGGK